VGGARPASTPPPPLSSSALRSPTPTTRSPGKPPLAGPTSTSGPGTRGRTRTGCRPWAGGEGEGRAVAGAPLAARLAAAALAAALAFAPALPAAAILNSPNARIARTPDAALRRAVPAVNLRVRKAQEALESIQFQLRIPQRKPWADMAAKVGAAVELLGEREAALAGAPPSVAADADAALDRALTGLAGVRGAIDARDPGVTARRLGVVLADVAALEVLQAPGLVFALPRDLESLPRLTGRATVEVVVVRGPKNAPFEPAKSRKATLIATLDGYSAPVTAGAFTANALAGAYNGTKLTATGTAVLGGAGVRPGEVLPLEILPAGAFEPLYRAPLELATGELPTLPLSIYGALAMARPPGSPAADVSAGEFFFFLFSKQQAGLGGLAFDEGEFPVFGYVTGNAAALAQIAAGDSVESVRVVAGADRLVKPGAAAPTVPAVVDGEGGS